MPKYLLKFQIGPVQDFIAQARSTRDLWSGSYLLSWLVAAGIRVLPRSGEELVFPSHQGQRLLKESESWKRITGDPNKELLTPNLPNLFVAEVEAEKPETLADDVVSEIKREWSRIVESSLKMLVGMKVLEPGQETEFRAQASTFPSISWQITPNLDYRESFEKNGKDLDAIRQTRNFHAYPIRRGGEKDSLSSKDLALVGGKDFQDKMAARGDYLSKLFKHADHLSAITLIKRVWHWAYLDECMKINTGSAPDHFTIRSTHAIAARTLATNEEPDSGAPNEEGEEKYLAAIAFDGDSIGKWISGHYHQKADSTTLREFHRKFSGCLSDFALKRVRSIVEEIRKDQEAPEGFLIYSGGDDVVALTAADTALEIVKLLRDAFLEETVGIIGQDPDSKANTEVIPEASVGIAIAHFKAPLQDLIRAAHGAEKHAKNTVGRPAFSVSIMRRSGAISQWGANWQSGAYELHQEILGAIKEGKLSRKFPHRVCQLIEPYLTQKTGLSSQPDADGFDAVGVVAEEFRHAATRQGSPKIATTLNPMLLRYLNHLAEMRTQEQRRNPERTFKNSLQQAQLQAIIGLCTTIAFAARSLPKAERHANA